MVVVVVVMVVVVVRSVVWVRACEHLVFDFQCLDKGTMTAPSRGSDKWSDFRTLIAMTRMLSNRPKTETK